MKIAIKNFITTLKRYKIASLLNVAGLTLAFVALYIIMTQVYNATTFNSSIKDAERVYMLSPFNEFFGGWQESIPNPVSYETAEERPDVECIASMTSYINENVVWVNTPDGYDRRNASVVRCSSPLLDVFSFDILVGNADDFKQMNAAVVSQSAAERMGVTVGSVINLEEGELKPGTPLTVVAIFKDFASNTILAGKDIFRNDNRENGMDNSNWNYSVFLKMREGADTDAYTELWNKKFWEFNMARYAEYVAATGNEMSQEELEKNLSMPIRFVPMDEFYFGADWEDYPCGSWNSTMTMLAIALVIVLVAFINFVNFFMALVPVRMRSVNICKVFGAGQWTLRRNFFFEAIGLVAIALVIALYVVSVLDGGFISQFVEYPLAVGRNGLTVVLVVATALLMSVVAAAYPAFYITRFNASLAVKKGFASSKAGRVLRSVLLSLQFIVSMVLIILALVFSMQYAFMLRYDVGVERENLLEVQSSDLNMKSEVFISALENNPDIVSVTSVNNHLFGHTHSEQTRTIKGNTVEMNLWFVRHNALEVLGIPLIMGEGFTKGKPGVVITDYTSQATGLGLGDTWDRFEIVGIIPHICFEGANKAKVNTMLKYWGQDTYCQAYYVRLNRNVNVEAVCSEIRNIAKSVEPNAGDLYIEFADKAIAKVYGDTRKQTVLVAMFAFIAVVISLMGVFGIVMFETQHRRAEIAVRKVYGATSGSVVAMFNRRYLIIVALCSAVAMPVAWVISSRWLEQFVNRISLSLWLPVAVFVAVAAITAMLVTVRSMKAATENPADVVKSN